MYRRCEIELTYEELDNLWNSLNVPPDGILSYSALVQHYVAARHEPPPVRNKLPMGKIHTNIAGLELKNSSLNPSPEMLSNLFSCGSLNCKHEQGHLLQDIQK